VGGALVVAPVDISRLKDNFWLLLIVGLLAHDTKLIIKEYKTIN
jgi:hypothetical protein